ncbi:hypothetical protein J6590_070331 [Homalodisca vitripennis]|nr:hypothetical protein J6590_070331 [Homalodisca vitripennis]
MGSHCTRVQDLLSTDLQSPQGQHSAQSGCDFRSPRTLRNVMAPLPKTTPEGYKILLYRLADTDPSKLNFQDCLVNFFAYNDVRVSEDGLAEGYIVVFDMKGCSLGHLARVSTCMSLVRKFMVYIQDCHPVRLKGVHVINTASFIDSCLALVKPFMQSGLIQLVSKSRES